MTQSIAKIFMMICLLMIVLMTKQECKRTCYGSRGCYEYCGGYSAEMYGPGADVWHNKPPPTQTSSSSPPPSSSQSNKKK